MTLAVDFATGRVLATVQACLDKVVDAAANLGVQLPGRQIVAPGTVPYDCEQVLAYVITVSTGAPEAAQRSGLGTYPNSGANMTIYNATIQLAIVRKTSDTPTGQLGTTPPPPSAYLTNLTQASADTAVMIRALELLTEESIVGAIPRTVTYAPSQGNLFATTARISLVV